jgi:hypothetical protein
MPQFLDHPVSTKTALLSVVEHVHPNKAGEHSLEGFVDGMHYRFSITLFVNSDRENSRKEKFRPPLRGLLPQWMGLMTGCEWERKFRVG